MLSFINVASPIEIKKYIDEFDLKKSTWIVSDLKSKLDIQNHCLEKYGYFLDDSILRISDFWRLWLRRLSPEISVVSSDFIKVLVQNFLNSDIVKSLQEQVSLEYRQSSTVHHYLTELAPIILSPQSDEIMREWLKNKNKSWSKWYLISRLCLNYLIQEKKVIDSSWVPSYIQNLDLQSLQWNKHIFLDLGTEMTSVEMGLFQQMAHRTNVTIFVPDPEWKNKYKYLLNTYSTHSGYSQISKTMATSSSVMNINPKECLRFATEALEIKFIVHQVRQWIEEGVAPKKIGLVSPRIEDYWPALKIHLDAEGVPYNKKHVTTLLGLGGFQLLLSKLKSLSTEVTWESLEQSYYGPMTNEDSAQSILDYEKFKAQFIELTDAEDLLRNEDIKKIFYNKINLKENLSRIHFLAFLLKIGNDLGLSDEQVYLEMAFKDFLSRTVDGELNLEQWIGIFSAGLSKKEIVIQKANTEGIDVGSSNSSHLMNVEHIIWFGLDESGFRKNAKTMIPLEDIEELKFNFDFPINYPEESHTEFNIRWFSQYQFKNQFFTCSLSSTQAEPLNASALILERNIHPDVVFDLSQYSTQVDILQIQQVSSMHATGNVSHSRKKLSDESRLHEIIVDRYKPQELSMTDFINYDHCGFKLLAAKGFKLKQYPITSIDLDPRQRGSIAHALFEFLIKDKRYKKFDTEETNIFLDQRRIDFKLYLHMDDFWTVQKKKLLDIAARFCDFEKNRIGLFELQHLVEVDFKWPLRNLSITGRIDRIDIYKDQSALVIDYKRSESENTSYGTHWMEKREFQMLFYILALQDVLQLKDIGAYYFFYKNLDFYKGLLNESAGHQIEVQESLHPTKKVQMSDEDYQKLKIEFKDYIWKTEKKLQSGLFTALPYKVEICDYCEWNTLCRAAHL